MKASSALKSSIGVELFSTDFPALNSSEQPMRITAINIQYNDLRTQYEEL